MRHDLEGEIENFLNVGVVKIGPLSGGCVGEVHRVRLADGSEVVVKVDRGGAHHIDREGFMLRYLAEHSTLPVPSVRHCSDELLIMDFVEGDSHFSGGAQRHAAELLAELHTIGADKFGLEQPTLIGSLHQPNPWTDSWVDFFRDHRLFHMAEKAAEEGPLDGHILKRIRRFGEKLDDWIDEPAQPSLLHGDVWTTNILALGDRITAFIDPAVYYGHPEIELAFITLFHTFGEPFFDRYEDVKGIAPGFFEERRDIYNMYPLLVHVRLFGSSYLSGVESVLSRHGF